MMRGRGKREGEKKEKSREGWRKALVSSHYVSVTVLYALSQKSKLWWCENVRLFPQTTYE